MRDAYRKMMDLLCRPWIVAAMFAIVLAGLYVFEKIAANMPFVAMWILAISAFVFLFTRKLAFSLYFGMALSAVITVVSAIKYRMKGFDLHVFDFGFTGGDPQAIQFLWDKYASLIVPVIVLAVVSVVFLVAIGFADRRLRVSVPSRISLLTTACLGIYATYPLSADQPRYFHYLGGFNASSFFVSTLDLQYLFKQGEFAQRMRAVPAQAPFPDTVDCGDPSKLPDVFMVLSESQTDPRLFPQLKIGDNFKSDFRSGDGKVRPLSVETFGGGTWVSSISVVAGLSSTDFGVEAPYLTTVLDGKVRGALPEVLARCGYRTVEITPVSRGFVNEGPFMESIGFQTVLDYDNIGATQYAHRDNFYYNAALDVVRAQRKAGGGPLLLTLKTMFAHSPYDQPLAKQDGLPVVDFGGGSDTNEYMDRMMSSQNDFKAYLEGIKSLTTDRGSVVLEYGDHQSFVTKPLADQVYGGNSIVDLNSVAYKTYYTVNSFKRDLDMSAFRDNLDIGFLGAALVQAAALPTSPMYRDLIALKDYCNGRFRDCADRSAVDRHLRKRVDSGMLNIF